MTAAMRAPTAVALGRRFAALTEGSPVPTLLAGRGMRLALVNDAFCALVGRPAEELLGTRWLASVHPDDRDALSALAADAPAGGVELQARLVREDGGVRTTVLRFAPVSTSDDGAGLVGTVEDVTDRLVFAAELARGAGSEGSRPLRGAAAGRGELPT